MKEFIVGKATTIASAGQTLLGNITTNVSSIISTVTTKTGQILGQIKDKISGYANTIATTGTTLFNSLVRNAGSIGSTIVTACSGILTRIKTAFTSGVSSMISIGGNLASGIWTGLSNAASSLYTKVSNLCSGLWKKIKSFFGISSPSKLFRDSIGANLALGLGLGFEDEMNKVADQMQAAVPTTLDAGGISLNGVNGTVAATSGPLISIQQMIVRSEDDIRAISQQLYNMIQQSSRAQGYFTTA